MKPALHALTAALLLMAAVAAAAPPTSYGYRIVATHPADRSIFTQGILFQREGDSERLYVSSGLYNTSRLRLIELSSRRILAEQHLPARYFGEGITRVGNEIIQLTWKEEVALRYRADTLEPLGYYRYRGEGWGLTVLDGELVMSNGSAELTMRDPETFEERRRIAITANGRPVTGINALQEIEGRIYANIWPTTRIARIELPAGEVTGWLDMAELVEQVERQAAPIDVLNGIAYDPEQRRVFIAGKLWPWIFEVESAFFQTGGTDSRPVAAPDTVSR